MVSVVVAAHNEEAVIGGCLDALGAQQGGIPVEVVVSANGCSDGTAKVASAKGALVVDRPEPGKAGALNAGDAVASSFPRVYLDADIVLPADALSQVVARLDESPPVLAVVPRRRIDTSGRPWAVRAYFAINERLPAFRTGLFGRGMIAISEAGRARFEQFPAHIADDLFLDSLFADDERAQLTEVEVVVAAPHGVRDLVGRLERVRRGNAQLRAAAQAGEISDSVRPSDRWAWLRDVVLHEPRLAPSAIPYVAITLCAALLARRSNRGGWGRDESTRSATATPSGGAS